MDHPISHRIVEVILLKNGESIQISQYLSPAAMQLPDVGDEVELADAVPPLLDVDQKVFKVTKRRFPLPVSLTEPQFVYLIVTENR